MTTDNLQLMPDWLDAELWEDFKAYRAQETKKPLGPIAEKRLMRKIMKLHSEGCDVNAAIERSLINGWRDVFFVAPEQPSNVTRMPERQIRAVTRGEVERAARPGETYEQAEARIKRERGVA